MKFLTLLVLLAFGHRASAQIKTLAQPYRPSQATMVQGFIATDNLWTRSYGAWFRNDRSGASFLVQVGDVTIIDGFAAKNSATFGRWEFFYGLAVGATARGDLSDMRTFLGPQLSILYPGRVSFLAAARPAMWHFDFGAGEHFFGASLQVSASWQMFKSFPLRLTAGGTADLQTLREEAFPFFAGFGYPLRSGGRRTTRE